METRDIRRIEDLIAVADCHCLQVHPSYVIHVRGDIFEETDGPMLWYSLQGF